MLSKLFRSAQKCNLFFCTFKWEFHRFWLHEWTWETPSLSKVPALQKSSKITQDKSFCLGTRLTWKCNVFSVDVGFRFICTSMSANTGAYNTCHKLLKQTPFHLSFLEKFWHLLLAPLFSLKTLKCAPLLPPVLSHAYFGALRWLQYTNQHWRRGNEHKCFKIWSEYCSSSGQLSFSFPLGYWLVLN